MYSVERNNLFCVACDVTQERGNLYFEHYKPLQMKIFTARIFVFSRDIIYLQGVNDLWNGSIK